MFCFVYQTATDWTNRYCRYVFDSCQIYIDCNNVPCARRVQTRFAAYKLTNFTTSCAFERLPDIVLRCRCIRSDSGKDLLPYTLGLLTTKCAAH